MRLEHHGDAESSWTEVTGEPADFDAHPPVPRLRLDWPLGEAGPDRIAVGSALAFAPWIAGPIDLEEPFSALTAQRVGEWFATQGIWVSPGPVRRGGIVIPGATRRLVLADDVGSSTVDEGNEPADVSSDSPGSDSPSGDVRLRLVPSEEGTSIRGKDLRVATNAGVLGAHATRRSDQHAIRVGVTVLVAASLRVGEIVASDFAAECPEEFAAAARLLESVSLGLRPS